MSVIGVNQHLRVYVAVNSAGKVLVNDGGTTDTGLSDAVAFPVGSITYLKPDGTGVATAPTSGNFQVAYKDLNGKVFLSPVIKQADLIVPVAVKTHTARTQQVDKLTIPATPTVGAAYMIKLRCPEYGGLLGAEDEINFYGNYVVKTGDTASNVATGLAASLNLALNKQAVPFAVASTNAAVISVAGLEQPYSHGKLDGRLVRFDLSLALPASLARGKDASGNTLAVEGHGTYKHVAAAEEFYAGYNTDYRNRQADYPDDGNPTFAAIAGGQYTSHTIIFNQSQGGSDPVDQRQVIVCYFKTA